MKQLPTHPGSVNARVEHLYVHVPFCETKCHYCDFYSRPDAPAVMDAFVEALLRELDRHAAQLAPRTIFFGGGTPSLLTEAQWQQLLPAFQALGQPDEWTIECNPATLTPAKLELWRAHGVNRLSIGVQSNDDVQLRALSRIHTAAQAVASYRLARAAGFANINLDLMFGLPGQTRDQWRATLDWAIALAPEHLSAYCLTVEEGTALHRLGYQSDHELDAMLFADARAMLAAAGYENYEISNYARIGHACRHNLAYWEGKDYLGLGPSACSTVGDRRWTNVPDTRRYIAGMLRDKPVVSFGETLTPATRLAERVAFGLRMRVGVPAELVEGRWSTELRELREAGLLEQVTDRWQLTERGWYYADEVAAHFV